MNTKTQMEKEEEVKERFSVVLGDYVSEAAEEILMASYSPSLLH